jgi:hypothetical protein
MVEPALTVEELLTPQPSRVREAERLAKLLKALQRTKQAELRKLTQLKASLKSEEAKLDKISKSVFMVGSNEKFNLDETLGRFFPKISNLQCEEESEGEKTLEYKQRFESLSRRVKLGRLFPEDAGTDSEQMGSERKLRRIQKVEGSLDHLYAVYPAPHATPMQQHQPVQTGHSSGTRGLSYQKLRALRSN